MTIATTRVSASISGQVLSTVDIGDVSHTINYSIANTLSDGTGADQANMIWTDTRTLAASANESLDLAGGLTNAFGTTLTFTKVKAIMIKAAAGNTNSVQVTRPASNGLVLFMAAGDGIALTPGASFYACFPDANGVAVTPSTGDLLTITNSAGSTSVTYDIVIVGTV